MSTTGATTITRAFTTDESGAILKVTISGDPTALHNGTYLVTWNGHGDALALEKVETSGALTPANRYTYDTWGSPTTTTHNGYGDLRVRYLYVGQYGVTWDHVSTVPTGLHYMSARHYSAELGRFLQADPARLEVNHYGYAENAPVTKVDPDGEQSWKTRGKGGGGRGGGFKGAGAKAVSSTNGAAARYLSGQGLSFHPHAQMRMQTKGVSIQQVAQTVQTGVRIRYQHNGQRRGWYSPSMNILVTADHAGIIRTVIKPRDGSAYIRGLLRKS